LNEVIILNRSNVYRWWTIEKEVISYNYDHLVILLVQPFHKYHNTTKKQTSFSNYQKFVLF
jgi:hypothetical protein